MEYRVHIQEIQSDQLLPIVLFVNSHVHIDETTLL